MSVRWWWHVTYEGLSESSRTVLFFLIIFHQTQIPPGWYIYGTRWVSTPINNKIQIGFTFLWYVIELHILSTRRSESELQDGTTGVHQILFETWQVCDGDSRHATTGLPWPCSWSNTSVWVACPLQIRTGICGRRGAIRASDHEQNDGENRRIQALIHEDRRRTIHESSALVSIGYSVCQVILTENLNMRRVAAKFVPRLLTTDQKERRLGVCSELRELETNDPSFL